MSEHAHAQGHHTNYVKIYVILLGLLVVSILGPELNIRVVTLITAFGIALVKAYMVAKNFMHLDVEKPIIHWLLATALILMVLLYAGLAPDVQKGTGQNWAKDKGWHEQAAPVHHGGDKHGSGATEHH